MQQASICVANMAQTMLSSSGVFSARFAAAPLRSTRPSVKVPLLHLSHHSQAREGPLLTCWSP